jgi:hypothetical protein
MTTKLTLSGDISYEGNIDNFLAAKVIALVEQGESYNSSAQTDRDANILPSGGMFADRSLLESFSLTGATTNPQKIAVAGQRSMEEGGSESFTSKDIAEQFRSGGVSSKNLGRDLSMAVRQGLIFSVTGQRGQYKLTDIAKTGFKEGFDEVKLLKASSSKRKSRKGGVVQRLDVSDEVKNLPAEVSQGGYPDYHDLKMKGNRMVWLLIFAADHGIQSLNSREIEYLSRQVGDQISPTSISSLALPAIRRGLVAKTEGKFRPLEKAKTFLRQGQENDQA